MHSIINVKSMCWQNIDELIFKPKLPGIFKNYLPHSKLTITIKIQIFWRGL